ncbi:L-threonylcarbamoyladenylate synthase [Planctomicrobium sp. SH664]|uniref:L-threonylcarbamoyladenylate synthase n=1 Tax=Planctomicrobium sp. SH664 TaxID=3448125 RepID=UPI003F5B0A77
MPALLTTDIEFAAEQLRTGKLVAFATETVYGLGGNALDPQAVAGIFAAKQRPYFDPLIVHLADADQIDQVVADVSAQAQLLIDHFWPGPLTLVLPKQPIVSDLVTAGLPTVAVRVPSHPQARDLIRRAGIPVAAPSANPFGGISPTTAQHVLQQLGDRIDVVVEGGSCSIGLESTILQLRDGLPPLLLRAGGLTSEAIEAVVGTIERVSSNAHSDNRPQIAPGMLARHYAPEKPLVITSDWEAAPHGSSVGILTLCELPPHQRYGHVEVLSASGSLIEAAANFFSALRRLEAAPVQTIVAQPFPDIELGRALNDRLRRAAVPKASE